MMAIIVDSMQVEYFETSSPMGNFLFFLEVMTEIVTVRPTDRRIDRVKGKFHFQQVLCCAWPFVKLSNSIAWNEIYKTKRPE